MLPERTEGARQQPDRGGPAGPLTVLGCHERPLPKSHCLEGACGALSQVSGRCLKGPSTFWSLWELIRS